MAGIIRLGGDWHLGHRKAADWRGFKSIEEHDQSIIRSALDYTNRRDSVIILGDVCFRPASYFDELLERYLPIYFNGWTKGDALPFDLKVIGGNHDRQSLINSKYIKSIQGCIELKSNKKKLILTHIPIHPCSAERWDRNIHAHLHANSVADDRYICVSYERVGSLISLNHLIKTRCE